VIETTLTNLFTIQDEMDSKISYSEWREDCVVGNLITLKLRSDFIITVRLMSMEFSFDDPDSISLIFSDKNRLDDELTQLGEILGQAQNTSKSLSLNYYGYDKASKSTSSLLEFKNGIFNATLNKMQNNIPVIMYSFVITCFSNLIIIKCQNRISPLFIALSAN
jgi:hypothetical protein